MKIRIIRAVSAFLTVFLFLPAIFVAVSASGTEPSDAVPFYDITCAYDPVTEKVKLGYRMRSDTVKKYSSSTVSVYALSPGQTFADIAESETEPVASGYTPSNKASLEFRTETLKERLSSYVLAIGEGSETVYSEPIYPFVDTCACESAYKGIEPGNGSVAVEAGAGTAVLGVDVSKLESKSGGYVAAYGGVTYSFNRAYLSELDTVMKNWRGAGCDVYLRFYTSDGTPLVTGTPENQCAFYAYSAFLFSRYSSDEYGGADGIILGRRQDTASVSVRTYAAALYAVAAGVSDLGRTTSVVVPVTESFENAAGFLDGLCVVLKNTGSPAFTVMVESSSTPYGADDDYAAEIASEPDAVKAADREDEDTTDDIARIRARLQTLAQEYGCLYTQILVNWTPGGNTTGFPAVAAYVYNYYRYLSDGKTVSFIVLASGASENALFDAVRYIDTNRSAEFVNGTEILDYYGIKDWKDEFRDFNVRKAVKRTLNSYSLELVRPGGIIGETAYFDFSSTDGMSGWYGGIGCLSLASGKVNGTRALVASFDGETAGNYSTSVVYNYKYTESFKYTDYIAVEFSLENDSKEAKGQEYSLDFALGGDGFVSEYSLGGFKPDRRYTVYLNATEFTESNPVKYFRILATSKTPEKYSLCLYSVKAESTKYDSGTLGEYIESERERLKKLTDETAIPEKFSPLAVFFVAAAVLVTVVVMIAISRRRKIENDRKENSKL